MLLARFHSNKNIKYYSCLLSFSTIYLGNYLEPLNMDSIEESFIVIPLTYVILYPGSLWPIASAFFLLTSYTFNLSPSDFDEFLEDAIELLAISGFASVMVFYQQKLKQKVNEYRNESYTDFLTQLKNRKRFYYDIKKIENSEKQKQYALLQIDVDNFKHINDNLGHQVGDSVLVEFSNRLKSIETQNVTVYRIGGDEFTVIITSNDDITDTTNKLIEIILNLTHLPYTDLKSYYELSVCIGVSIYNPHHSINDIWFRNVDIALYKAKQKGTNNVQWFDDALMSESCRIYQLEQDMLPNLIKGNFYLLYQPKLTLSSNEIIGVEALIRWNHSTLGVISPSEFIPIAEKNHHIISIGRWALTEACKQGKIWCDNGTPISVSVNVSIIQLANDDIVKTVKTALTKSGLEPHYLQLEITETAIMKNPAKIIEKCQQLRKLGISIAIDDFGTDYSSLSHLKQLPIDVIKIDKSFIKDCAINETDHMIVRTIIQLGHNLGLTVTAEGVENEEQLRLLKSENCNKYQGYYFSKPINCNQTTSLLLEQHNNFLERSHE